MNVRSALFSLSMLCQNKYNHAVDESDDDVDVDDDDDDDGDDDDDDDESFVKLRDIGSFTAWPQQRLKQSVALMMEASSSIKSTIA